MKTKWLKKVDWSLTNLVTGIMFSVLITTGVNAESINVYAPAGWPTIHRDPINSDTSPVVGSSAMVKSWRITVGGIIPAYASIAPDGTVYFTSGRIGPHLFAVNGDTGIIKWRSNLVNMTAAASTPLIDNDGNIYIGDDTQMCSFMSDGALRWSKKLNPESGSPVSAQFTGDGNLLFVTVLGDVYVLDRATGDLVIPAPYRISNISENGSDEFFGCLTGEADCPVANTPAIDLDSGLFTLTVGKKICPEGTGCLPSEKITVGALDALRYIGGENPHIEEVWSNQNLEGGSASSPTFSSDKTRIYVNDRGDHLLSIDAATGNIIWEHDIGFSAVGSPSVSADGIIIPASGIGDSAPLLAIIDENDVPRELWKRSDVVQLGVPAQAAGGVSYTFIRSGALNFRTQLLTFSTLTGETLDIDDVGGTALLTVGTSIGPNGEVITPALGGTVYAFRPE